MTERQRKKLVRQLMRQYVKTERKAARLARGGYPNLARVASWHSIDLFRRITVLSELEVRE